MRPLQSYYWTCMQPLIELPKLRVQFAFTQGTNIFVFPESDQRKETQKSTESDSWKLEFTILIYNPFNVIMSVTREELAISLKA